MILFIVLLGHNIGGFIEILHKLRETINDARALAGAHADEVTQSMSITYEKEIGIC